MYTIPTVSQEQRERAIAILQEKRYRGYGEAEKILGWAESISMPRACMEELLHLTKGQLRRLLWGDEQNQRARARRAAVAQAEAVEFVPCMSKTLRFSIGLPKDWTVITETREPEPLAQQLLRWLLRKQSHPAIRGMVARESRSKTIALHEYQRAKEQRQERIDKARRHADLERMVTGLLQASGPHEADSAEVEVSKLRFVRPLSSLELYTMDKSLPEDVPWGNRPAKGLVIDGLQAVTYSYLYETDDAQNEWPVYFNNYLVDGLEGWIISCSCNYGGLYFKTFSQYKPLFQRIAKSFRRLRAI